MRRLPITQSILLLFSVLSFAFVVHAEKHSFPDIQGHKHQEDIELLSQRGVIEGYSDRRFRPDQSINRAEFLKILTLAAFGEEALEPRDSRCFQDFIGSAKWFWPLACTAKERGIINGYPDGTFQGERTVNLVEALKMTVEAWKIEKPPLPEDEEWYQPYVSVALSRDIPSLFPLAPAHLLLRGEASSLLVGFGEEIADVSKELQLSEPSPEIVEEQASSLPPPPAPALVPSRLREPIRHGNLRIEQTGFANIDVSEGTQDVLLLRFRAVAGRQDVSITSLIFEASTGSLETAQNYRILADHIGDGSLLKYGTNARIDGNNLTISPLDLPVYRDSEVTVELRADIVHNPAVSSVALSFKTSDPLYIGAVGREDGRELAGITTNNVDCPSQYSVCWTAVFTQTARVIGVVQTGNLYVTQGTVPVSSHQILLGATSETLLRVTLRAENEDMEVTELSIEDGNSSITSLELLKAGETLPFAIAYTSGCDAVSSDRFCVQLPTNALLIPRDGEQDILVRARLKSDADGGRSGESFTLALTGSTASSVRAVEARGISSDTDLSQNDGDSVLEGEIFIGRENAGANTPITGPTHDTAASLIDAIVNNSPDEDGGAVHAGTSPIGTFRFSSPSHGNTLGGLKKVTIQSLRFEVSALNVEVNSESFLLYNKGNASVTTSCESSGSTGNITVTCSNLTGSTVSTQISPGGSIDLVLQATIENTEISPGSSSLQVRLENINNRNLQGPITWDDGTTTFTWVDLDNSTVRSTQYR